MKKEDNIKPAKPHKAKPAPKKKPPKAAPKKKDPAPEQKPAQADPQRNANGTFAKGHTKTGGIQLGQKQKLSLHIQNQILALVSDEFDSQRFLTALQVTYAEDPAKYLQALLGYMKFCAPTLQATSLDLQSSSQTRTIDDRLDELMKTITPAVPQETAADITK